MKGILSSSISDWIREILSTMIMGNLGDMLSSVNMQAAELGGEISMTPSAWNPSIWSMIQNVADVAITPIAAGILVYAMCFELISLVNDKNNLHSTADVVGMFIKFIIKLGIGVLLVQKATEITMGIFDLSAYAVAKSMGMVVTDPGQLAVELEAVRESLQDAELGSLMSLAFTSQLGKLGMMVVGLVVKLIIAGRMIEIYIYCACGTAPYATLTSKQLVGIGGNYIKNLLALAFQGFFMFIMLGIYVALMHSTINSVTGSGKPEVMITEIILVSATLCMMLLRSKTIAKSIFSAH